MQKRFPALFDMLDDSMIENLDKVTDEEYTIMEKELLVWLPM